MTVRRFVILCVPRTGSNWLCGMLDTHPQVLCHHELFHPDGIFYAFECREGERPDLGDVATRDEDPLAFLQRVWDMDRGKTVLGFKLMHDHDPRVHASVLADKDLLKVVLRRRNRVATFVSKQRAAQTGHWAQRSYEGLRVRIDPKELQAFAAQSDAFHDELDRQLEGHTVKTVTYEELGDSQVQLDLLSFLGADTEGVTLEALHRRQSSGGLGDAIENLGQLQRALKGTPLAAELEEGLGR